MKFRIIESKYADIDSIHDDFVKDYIHSSDLSNPEIRKKYKLTHGEFKELCDSVKKEFGLTRRPTRIKGKYYYKADGRYRIEKTIDGKLVYLGTVPSEEAAIKVVELCKEINWKYPECEEIVKSWRDYV